MPRTIKMFKNMWIFVPKKMFINTCVKMPLGFTNITSFTARTRKLVHNTWFKRFHWKTSSDLKYLPPLCQILQNFTLGNLRKFTVSFAFYSRVDTIKYRKTLTPSRVCRLMSFHPQCACGRKIKGSHHNRFQVPYFAWESIYIWSFSFVIIGISSQNIFILPKFRINGKIETLSAPIKH